MLVKHLQASLEMESCAPPTRFDDLSPELRQEIWRLVLPGARLISVNRFLKPPLALHINRESRSVALRHYELILPRHPDDESGHIERHRCVGGYIDFEVDIIPVAGLYICGKVRQKVRHLQDNSWLWQQISSTRTFLMTDFALATFPRMRSYKTIVHFNPSIQGVEFQNLPTRITEEGFQTRIQLGADRILQRIEETKTMRTEEGLSWEPPAYYFVRCEREVAGLECEKPNTCSGYLDEP